MGDREYTLADLSAELPEQLIVQLYVGHLPDVLAFLDEIALNALLSMEAEARGVADRPEVKARVDAAVQEAKFEQARTVLMIERAKTIPEADLREFFQQNESRYQTLKTMDVDVILIKPEEGELFWECQKRAEVLVEKLRAGQDFAQTAREQSLHFSAANGGRMEHLTTYGVGRFLQPRPAFSGMLNALEEGEISDPFVAECYEPDRLRFLHVGVMIVRMAKRYPPEPITFEGHIDRVRNQYVRRHFQRLEAELRADLLREAGFKVYEQNLPPV
jgi:hypothetical protein